MAPALYGALDEAGQTLDCAAANMLQYSMRAEQTVS